MQGWLFPYIRSRVTAGDFHPLIAYLFTEFKCNLDCHYCWAFDNKVKGMSEDMAKRSIDWLHGTGCRVLAYMGGEPLLRPDLIHRITYYAAKKDFWIYLPTNARLLRTDVIDKLADAGMSTFNIAVDAVDLKTGLPKALAPIRKQFDYLVRKQYGYGYSVFLNINICRNNLDDVRQLTEIAHDNGIATDYHINESPLLEQDEHFQHAENNVTYITKNDWPAVEETVEWLAEKQDAGYKMVNSNTRLRQMVDFMKGKHFPWNCRAGQNSMIIRVDGTLAPCFPMYMASYDWGVVGNHKFDTKQLDHQKETLPNALLFHAQSHSRLVLQRPARHQVFLQAASTWFPGNERAGIAIGRSRFSGKAGGCHEAAICSVPRGEPYAGSGQRDRSNRLRSGNPSQD